MSIIGATQVSTIAYVPLSPWSQVGEALRAYGSGAVPEAWEAGEGIWPRVPKQLRVWQQHLRSMGAAVLAKELNAFIPQLEEISARAQRFIAENPRNTELGLELAGHFLQEAAKALQEEDFWYQHCEVEWVMGGESRSIIRTPFLSTELEIHALDRSAKIYALGIIAHPSKRRDGEEALARYLQTDRALIDCGVDIGLEPSTDQWLTDCQEIAARIARVLPDLAITGAALAAGLTKDQWDLPISYSSLMMTLNLWTDQVLQPTLRIRIGEKELAPLTDRKSDTKFKAIFNPPLKAQAMQLTRDLVRVFRPAA